MKYGTRLKLKKDWEVSEYITIEKNEILIVIEYYENRLMRLKNKNQSFSFKFDENNKEELIKEYFEILDNKDYDRLEDLRAELVQILLLTDFGDEHSLKKLEIKRDFFLNA